MKKDYFKGLDLTYRENNLKDVVLSVLSLNGATREETIKVCKFIIVYNQMERKWSTTIPKRKGLETMASTQGLATTK